MKKWGTRCLRPTSMLAMAALILILPACGSSGGGGGGGGPGAPTASFMTNDAATAGDPVAARSEFERALVLEPGHRQATRALGELH